MKRIALITVGQAPRDDILPDILPMIPASVEILQIGALDDLTIQEIRRKRPKSADKTLVTRLANGQEVYVDKDFIYERMQGLIKLLEKRVDLIGLLCSGTFPDFPARIPVLYPARLLRGVLTALTLPGPLGVLVPTKQQVVPTLEELHSWGVSAICAAASPYSQGIQTVVTAAHSLVDQGAVAVLLHCFGYTSFSKAEIQASCGKPVILVRTIFARFLAELV